MKRKMKGFTLTELVITLVTIIILMSISIPMYSTRKGNFEKAEGYALLATIRSAQQAYYSQYGQFLCSSCSSAGPGTGTNVSYFTCNETVLGINAITNKYYTYFSVSSYRIGFSPYNHSHKAFNACARNTKNEEINMYYDLDSGVTFY